MARAPSKLLSIRVSRQLSARLASLSRRRRVPVSAVVREALERYTGSEQPSIWDSARHLFEGGAWRGARDLSSNKKHLKGYGR